MKLLLQASIHLIKKVITFVIYERSVQVSKACTLFCFFPAAFFLLADNCFSSHRFHRSPQIFLHRKIFHRIIFMGDFSSDFTDESEGILAYRITHGFSQNFGRWPMARARYMLLLFFCHADFTDYHRFFMESLVNLFIQSQGVSATTGQVASAKIRE